MLNDEIKTYAGHPPCMENLAENERKTFEFLDNLNIDYTTLCHREAFSMEECERIRMACNAPVFKNLFLTNKQQTQFYLLMISADKPFKTKYLSSQIGCARLSFAGPEFMKELLNIQPGAVSPMGLIFDTGNKVRLLIDSDLKNTELYACHPCVNTASIVMKLSDLLEKVIPATGHNFTWVDLPYEIQAES